MKAQSANAPFQLVIFDFDGTLVDTETVIFQTWQEKFRAFGRELEFKRWQGVAPGKYRSALLARQMQ